MPEGAAREEAHRRRWRPAAAAAAARQVQTTTCRSTSATTSDETETLDMDKVFAVYSHYGGAARRLPRIATARGSANIGIIIDGPSGSGEGRARSNGQDVGRPARLHQRVHARDAVPDDQRPAYARRVRHRRVARA